MSPDQQLPTETGPSLTIHKATNAITAAAALISAVVTLLAALQPYIMPGLQVWPAWINLVVVALLTLVTVLLFSKARPKSLLIRPTSLTLRPHTHLVGRT